MKVYAGLRKLMAFALMVVLLLVLCCGEVSEAHPGKNAQSLSSAKKASSAAKKANAPHHSLGGGARAMLGAGGVAGGVASSLS
uniref:Putative secreted protein n=1 Tax=Anopheles nuneztovari TaxID=30067 RepID=A0A2M3YW60_9DIPT